MNANTLKMVLSKALEDFLIYLVAGERENVRMMDAAAGVQGR